jgi:hypothetical protein
MLDRPEDQRYGVKANKAIPHNTVYVIDEMGRAEKYIVVDEDITYE